MPSTPEVLRRTGGQPVKSIVFDEATIAAKVEELGAEITEAYPDGELLVLGLLKGSFIFLSDLVRKIERPIQVDFLVASSYGNGKKSPAETVRLLYDPETRLEGKHILLVEDIIDTGNTLQQADQAAGRAGAGSLAICALLDKLACIEADARSPLRRIPGAAGVPGRLRPRPRRKLSASPVYRGLGI